MKKFDAAHPVWNRILGVVYLPLVFVCSLGGMMGEAVMYEQTRWSSPPGIYLVGA